MGIYRTIMVLQYPTMLFSPWQCFWMPSNLLVTLSNNAKSEFPA